MPSSTVGTGSGARTTRRAFPVTAAVPRLANQFFLPVEAPVPPVKGAAGLERPFRGSPGVVPSSRAVRWEEAVTVCSAEAWRARGARVEFEPDIERDGGGLKS